MLEGQMSDQKPKIWWCIKRPGDLVRLACDTQEEAQKYWEGFNPITPVIEKSAYDTVVKERAALRSAKLLKDIYCDQIEKETRREIRDLTAERDSLSSRVLELEKELKSAKDLEEIQINAKLRALDECSRYREALEKIQQTIHIRESYPDVQQYRTVAEIEQLVIEAVKAGT